MHPNYGETRQECRKLPWVQESHSLGLLIVERMATRTPQSFSSVIKPRRVPYGKVCHEPRPFLHVRYGRCQSSTAVKSSPCSEGYDSHLFQANIHVVLALANLAAAGNLLQAFPFAEKPAPILGNAFMSS